MSSKVFGIGLSRTGTSSLTIALRKLGYKTVHWPLSMSEIDQAQALTDITISCRFRELDKIYPGSKFIYTVRYMEKWLESVVGHYAIVAGCLSKLPPDRRLFAYEADLRCYGELSHLNGQHLRTDFQAAAHRHHDMVMDYFKDRKQDVLLMNIESGDGYRELCPFLGKPMIHEPFPHVNHDHNKKPAHGAAALPPPSSASPPPLRPVPR